MKLMIECPLAKEVTEVQSPQASGISSQLQSSILKAIQSQLQGKIGRILMNMISQAGLRSLLLQNYIIQLQDKLYQKAQYFCQGCT
ncbi:hypothetical protein FGO68_gene14934 [Halteria grandinella]|uniref:Uncharacterized protein n=1 Tax=Halteria grandinella TaxID=5974 RepID=A0A8J8NVR8_HALGN|nr:hypothetical protein FGO68_gene14934 [Halteria grandinella]